jgi:hypothetical protein
MAKKLSETQGPKTLQPTENKKGNQLKGNDKT